MQRGTPEHELWLRNVDPAYKAKVDSAAKPVEQPAPDLFVTMQAMRATLENVAAVIAPLIPRLNALEQKLIVLETKQNGITIAAQGVSIDGLGHMADVITMLNQTLTLPVKPIYDDRGILIGAERVRALDS